MLISSFASAPSKNAAGTFHERRKRHMMLSKEKFVSPPTWPNIPWLRADNPRFTPAVPQAMLPETNVGNSFSPLLTRKAAPRADTKSPRLTSPQQRAPPSQQQQTPQHKSSERAMPVSRPLKSPTPQVAKGKPKPTWADGAEEPSAPIVASSSALLVPPSIAFPAGVPADNTTAARVRVDVVCPPERKLLSRSTWTSVGEAILMSRLCCMCVVEGDTSCLESERCQAASGSHPSLFYLVSGHEDGAVNCWRCDSRANAIGISSCSSLTQDPVTCIRTFSHLHIGAVVSVRAVDGVLLSVSHDSLVRRCRIDSGQVLATYSCPPKATCASCHDNLLVAGSNSGNVVVFAVSHPSRPICSCVPVRRFHRSCRGQRGNRTCCSCR